MIYISFDSRTINETIKVKRTGSEYKELLNVFNKECLNIEKENESRKLIYNQNMLKIESLINNNIYKAKKEIFYNKLKPYKSISENKANIKRGKTELIFLNCLFEKFGAQIKVDVFVNSYQPDFVLICNKTNLHIDIEIDEPYTSPDNQPIHYIVSKDFRENINSIDDRRNKYFLDNNWCVVRFSEKQIVKETEKCVNLIENIVENIRQKSKYFESEVKADKRWTYEEALVLAYRNYRNSY